MDNFDRNNHLELKTKLLYFLKQQLLQPKIGKNSVTFIDVDWVDEKIAISIFVVDYE